jgi:DNA-binding MurR/RpiR family transcriptional regulator
MALRKTSPPGSLEGLRALVDQRYEDLPARLRDAARFLAKALGYTGFSQMQAVFRDALLAQSQSYGERVRAGAAPRAKPPREADDLLRMLCEGAIESLQGLREGTSDGSLQQAISLIAAAPTVHVLGMRRASPIANYLAYLLSRSRKFVRQLGAMPGMLDDEVDALGAGDLLVVISFQPFHALAVQAQRQALARGAKVLAMTDSTLSPIAKDAHGVLQVHDAEIGGFRSVAGAMVMCHALAVGLAASAGAKGSRAKR